MEDDNTPASIDCCDIVPSVSSTFEKSKIGDGTEGDQLPLGLRDV